jgi:hypothetical protein
LDQQPYARHRLTRHYTRQDIRLLALTDALHDTLNGPATKKILERQFLVYHQTDYERLATLSVSHLYNPVGTRRIPANAATAS